MTEVIESGDTAAKAKRGSKFKILLRLMQLVAIGHGVLQFNQFDDPIDGLVWGAIPALIFIVLSGFVWGIADRIRLATEPQRYYVPTTTFGTERITNYLQQNLWGPMGVLCSPVILLAGVILFGTHYLYNKDIGVFIDKADIQKHSGSATHAIIDQPVESNIATDIHENTASVDTMPKASFNCAKSSSDAEKLICSDSSLRTLDAEMGVLYSRLLKETPDQADLRRAQRTWVSEVRDACDSVECMATAYKTRLDELNQPIE